MSKADKKSVDALVLLARSSLGDRRRPMRRLLVIALVLFVLAGLLGWWLFSGSRVGEVLLAAYDQTALPDEVVTVSAQVEPLAPTNAPVNLSGMDLYFLGARADLITKVATTRDGLATTESSFGDRPGPVEFLVRYPGERNTRRGREAKGRVYVWPADAPVLIVDADHGLARLEEGEFWARNNLDIRPTSAATESLRSLRSRLRIAYLSASADRPSRYNKLRAWLERGWAPVADQFPDGPVLMASGVPGQPREVATLLTRLRRQFSHSLIGVTTQPEMAREFLAAGLTSILIGEAEELPAEVVACPSWRELGEKLSATLGDGK